MKTTPKMYAFACLNGLIALVFAVAVVATVLTYMLNLREFTALAVIAAAISLSLLLLIAAYARRNFSS